MNKRGLIKYIFVIVTFIISFHFIFTSVIGIPNIFSPAILISFMFAITIFMFYNMKKIKRKKFIYDVILLLLMIFSTVIFLYIFCTSIACFISPECSMELESLFVLIYPTLLFLILLFGFSDIFNKTNKVNDILVIVICIIIILIHIRYYLDPNFAHKLIDDGWYNEYSYTYITQNYVYFSIMYLLALSHYIINKISYQN